MRLQSKASLGSSSLVGGLVSRTSPKGCPKHHGHKGDPGVTPETCGAGGERPK